MTVGSSQSSDSTTLREQIVRASSSSANKLRRLLNVTEIPQWMRDNDFLRTGYRPPQSTVWSCLSSGLLELSNDCVNIYTHLVGFIVLLPITWFLLGPATSVSVYPTLPPCLSEMSGPTMSMLRLQGLSNACDAPMSSSSPASAAIASLLTSHRLGLAPLLLTALFCLCFSTVFHIFRVLSPRASASLVKLDFFGIAGLCVGHALTGLYYTYYCRHNHARPYYILIIIAFFMMIPAILSPMFSKPNARSVRSALFGFLAFLALFPVLRAALSMNDYADRIAVFSALGSIVVYACAGVIYVSRFPECCRVGLHDRFFSSHQLMHILVLLGIAAHLTGCYYLFTIRLKYGCSIPQF